MRDTSWIKAKAARTAIREMPFSSELNLKAIRHTVNDIMQACADVGWADDQLDDILGEDLANDFRLQYTDLCTACEDFDNDLTEYAVWTLEDWEEPGECYFDLIVGASGGADDMEMYDQSTSDYTSIWGYTEDYAARMASTKLKKLTKDKIIELMGDVIAILRNYWNISLRYKLLAGIFAVVQEEALHDLDTVKNVEKAWDTWNQQRTMDADNKLRDAIRQLPEMSWIL